jgi:hypothetical protein
VFPLAKICFYCGKELGNEERCTCNATTARVNRTADSERTQSASSDSGSRDRRQRKTAEKARKERVRKARQKEAKTANSARSTSDRGFGSGFFQRLALKLLSGAGFNPGDPFVSKVGYSLLQSLVRPVLASDHFIRNQDVRLSVFFLLLFSVAFSVFNIRLTGFSMVNFFEGFALGIGLAALLNGVLLLIFRFIARTRYSFARLLSAFCAPSVFLSLFLFLASVGRGSPFSLITTAMAGITAGSILHYLSLRSLTSKPDDRLFMHVILSYWIFFSIAGFILTVLMSIPLTA